MVGGATPSKKRPDYYSRDGIGWVTPRDLSNTNNKFIAHGADGITQAGYDSCSARLLRKGSVLFSSRAPIGYIAIADDELATNQGFKSVIPNPEVGTAFVYCFLKRNSRRIADMGAGTTFPEVSGKMMKAVELKLPEPETCRLFSTFAKPLLRMQRKCEVENVALESLRDTLLPKLMSGEIDVSKVNLTQLNSHLDAPSHRLPGHLTAPLIRVPRRKSSHPRRDLMCRNFSSFPRLGREQASQRHVKGPTALLPYRKIGRERWRNDNLQPATCGFVSGLRNYLPIFRQAAEPSSGEGHNLPHITKKSGPSWVPTRQFMVAGAGFEPTTFGL